MSTKGVVDIVFCLDASHSMRPCIDAVRDHVVAFVRGLEDGARAAQRSVDWRVDFLAHAADEGGGVYRVHSIRTDNMGTIGALYPRPDPAQFFTTDLDEFRRGLGRVEIGGDEATLWALDLALDYPWRSRRSCHRVVVCLTDEPFETNAEQATQRAQLPALRNKIQQLGAMLFLVAPDSTVFGELAMVDKSEYETVDAAGDGLRRVEFDKVLAYMGKSVSMAGTPGGTDDDAGVRRALYGQDQLGATDKSIRGR